MKGPQQKTGRQQSYQGELRSPLRCRFNLYVDANPSFTSTDQTSSWQRSGKVSCGADPQYCTELPRDRPLPTCNLSTTRHQGFFERYVHDRVGWLCVLAAEKGSEQRIFMRAPHACRFVAVPPPPPVLCTLQVSCDCRLSGLLTYT